MQVSPGDLNKAIIAVCLTQRPVQNIILHLDVLPLKFLLIWHSDLLKRWASVPQNTAAFWVSFRLSPRGHLAGSSVSFICYKLEVRSGEDVS